MNTDQLSEVLSHSLIHDLYKRMQRIRLAEEELRQIKSTIGEENYNKGKFKEASEMFKTISISDTFEEFLTIPAYELL